MHSFNFLLGVFLGELILRYNDNLSKTLQQKRLSAAEDRLKKSFSHRDILKGSLHSIAVLCKSRFTLVSLIFLFWESIVLLNALKMVPKLVIFIQQPNIITDRFFMKQWPCHSSNSQQVWPTRVQYPGSTCLEFFYGKALGQGATHCLRLLQGKSVEESTWSTAPSFETSGSRSSGNKQSWKKLIAENFGSL